MDITEPKRLGPTPTIISRIYVWDEESSQFLHRMTRFNWILHGFSPFRMTRSTMQFRMKNAVLSKLPSRWFCPWLKACVASAPIAHIPFLSSFVSRLWTLASLLSQPFDPAMPNFVGRVSRLSWLSSFVSSLSSLVFRL